jgi:hypothetical protein
VPVTFPAHQAVVLPLKLWRPSRFDATALCIGAAAPDLGYTVLRTQSHSWLGALLYALPLTLVASAVLRRGAAIGIAANLPDLGPFRLRSYGVLPMRRPGWLVTLVSAWIGVASHIVLDSFTHSQGWGAQQLGFDRVVPLPVRGDASIAGMLQYSGHVVLSLATLAMLLVIGRRRLLERWYGADVVASARRRRPSGAQRMAFWAIVGATTAAVIAAAGSVGRSAVFAGLLGGLVGSLLAGSLRAAGGAWGVGQSRSTKRSSSAVVE